MPSKQLSLARETESHQYGTCRYQERRGALEVAEAGGHNLIMIVYLNK